MGGRNWIRIPLKDRGLPPLPLLDLGLDTTDRRTFHWTNDPHNPRIKFDISLQEFEVLVTEIKRKEELLKKLSKRGNFPYLKEEDLMCLLELDARKIIAIKKRGIKATREANSRVKGWLQTNKLHLYDYLKREMESLDIPPSAEPIQQVSQFLKQFTLKKIREVIGRAFESLALSPRAREIATEIYVRTQYPFFIKHMRRILLGVLIEKNCVDLIFAFLCLGVKKKWY